MEGVSALFTCRHSTAFFSESTAHTILPIDKQPLPPHRIVDDTTPLPPPASTADEDEALFEDDPWVHPPIHIDYGTNVKLGCGVFINFNCTILDTCTVTVGARSLLGPNVSLFSGTHPLDPDLRNGTKGPELGKEIHVGEDVWIGGNVSILPGIRLGRGSVVGAGSTVTKDVPDFWIAAGNPARLIRKVETTMDPEHSAKMPVDKGFGAEDPMAGLAKDIEVKSDENADDNQGS